MKSIIGIIGGGFSGCMLAHHLLEKTEDLQVVIFNKSSRIGPGLAYEPQSSNMLLNVKAGKMSAFPSIPADFVDWLMEQNQFPLKTKTILKADTRGTCEADASQADSSQSHGNETNLRCDQSC